jgi:hypothetical protein
VGLKTRVCAALALLACLAGLTACGESDDQRAARETVSRFYEALKTHDARTACELVSPRVADAMIRAFEESDQSCVGALQHVFRRVAGSANPGFFDTVPSVRAAIVDGNHATVVVRRGYQRRRVGLTRLGDRWQITAPPNFQ